MPRYTYYLTDKAFDAWQENPVFEDGRTWRDIQMDVASRARPARARGCDGFKLVAPDGTVLAESPLFFAQRGARGVELASS